MKALLIILIMLAALVLFFSPVSAQGAERVAPLLEGLGNHHHQITTDSPEAQRFFDQGLILSYGFNHKEAERSFREAARLDPECAMCYWGIALVLGPNINTKMFDEAVAPAYEAAQKALELSGKASEKERAYVLALIERYGPAPVADRSSLDKNYAKAMGELSKRYPGDLDAATLYAESLMDLHPWDFWKTNGEMKEWTPEIVTTLERVLNRDPYHPGANHFYIHAIEASKNPERAAAAADRLNNLVPVAGHLVHMPSHIYIRVGRYHDGSLVNEAAIKADDEYIAQCRAQGVYPLAYVPHNHHFLWATTTMEGRSERAIEAARNTAARVDQTMMRKPGLGTLQHYSAIPYYALIRFGKWEEILAEPAPAADLVYPTGVYHYARGMALARTSRFDEAQGELEKVREIAANPVLDSVTIWGNNATSSLMNIASEVLAGELAASQGEYGVAVDHLKKAVEIEDSLIYDEPPDWFFPVRHSLGAVLLEAGRPADAEKVYREDLAKFPDNGWSLFGLMKSLEAQSRTQEAASVKGRFQKAWAEADIPLTASRLKMEDEKLWTL